MPKDFGKELRQGKAVEASSPFTWLGNISVVKRKQEA